MRESSHELKVGDRVAKKKGYTFAGTVQSVFRKRDGEVRIVVEMDCTGLLHIYSPEDVELTSDELHIQRVSAAEAKPASKAEPAKAEDWLKVGALVMHRRKCRGMGKVLYGPVMGAVQVLWLGHRVPETHYRSDLEPYCPSAAEPPAWALMPAKPLNQPLDKGIKA